MSVMMLTDTVMPPLTDLSITSGVMTTPYETTPDSLAPVVSTRVTWPVRVRSGSASNVRIALWPTSTVLMSDSASVIVAW